MVNPLTALLIGTAFIGVCLFIFWPGSGIVARWNSRKSTTERALMENALKHLYNCEYESVSCSIETLAGNLSISSDEATLLLTRLEAMGLVSTSEGNLKLTNDGRSYALRIIRVHRLWEKYLADETSVEELEWHTSAEEIEHQMSPTEADELAAQIGNPVFDPHGDPIPTSDGKIPVRRGKPLNDIKIGEFANIIHIEDEPNAIYTQLVAEGLYPGMQVRLIESTDKRIRFTANGEECTLAPLFAKNVTVASIKSERKIEGKLRKLSSLKIGEKGIVLGISKACRGQQRRRLMDMGVVPGTEIVNEMKSVGGDPIAYRIKKATVALRTKQADRIYLVPDEESEKNV